MRDWKKWLAAGCMAVLLGIGTIGTTAMAMGGGGVDRSEAVAQEEKVPLGKATQSSSSRAWKKINGICYNGSGQKLEGAITRGIDVSEWQDTINWAKVKKSNIDFAFIRISYCLNRIDENLTIIVSEETGQVSVAQEGTLSRGLNSKQLREVLVSAQNKKVVDNNKLRSLLKGRVKHEEKSD